MTNLRLFRIFRYLATAISVGLVGVQTISAFGLQKLEQQINISNGEFSTANITDSPTDNSLGLVSFDSSQYTGDTVYFEAVMRCDSCTGGNTRVSASLYNDAGDSQTTVTTTSTSYTRVRSNALSLAADEYTVRFKLDAVAGTAYIKAARLIIIQSDNNGLNDTQTQIEVGSYENSANVSATELSYPKYYVYDHDQWSGTINAYFEATFRTNNNDLLQTYYFNNYDSGGEKWTTTPENMVDSNTGTYASTVSDGQVQKLNGNTSPGSDLGQINLVEVRVFGYQTDGTDGQVLLRPVFLGSNDGDNHVVTPPEDAGNAAWSSYIDITDDTNAPTTWTWDDLGSLDMDVEFNQGASGSNTMFVSRVEFRVSYEDNTKIAYIQLYNQTNSQVVTTISSSDNDFQRIRSNALSSNWDTTNDDLYEVRMYTSHGDNAVYLTNAKIIIDQSDNEDIQEVELVHHMVTTARSQTNTIYTQESFLNSFDPAVYSNGYNSFKAFFEATMKTTASTGYLALYNVSGSDIINTPVNSELTTNSNAYERKRSSNLASNSDWPGATMDTIMKASTSQTAFVSNSWLIYQIKTVPAEVTFRVLGVADSQTNNGVTTSVTTTITSIPFGNLAVNTPKYAAQQLQVITNEASSGYTVEMRLSDPLQGFYPTNHFDPFGNGSSWTSPRLWITPTGTVPNEDTGWIGANITDSDVAGWNDSSAKFGPIDTSFVQVMKGEEGALDETEYVNYGVEVNVQQPADVYSTTLLYQLLPTY